MLARHVKAGGARVLQVCVHVQLNAATRVVVLVDIAVGRQALLPDTEWRRWLYDIDVWAAMLWTCLLTTLARLSATLALSNTQTCSWAAPLATYFTTRPALSKSQLAGLTSQQACDTAAIAGPACKPPCALDCCMFGRRSSQQCMPATVCYWQGLARN